MKVILPELAMVCLRRNCAVIFEGPDKRCPLCGWEGTTYAEIEALAIGNVVGAVGSDRPGTKVIQ